MQVVNESMNRTQLCSDTRRAFENGGSLLVFRFEIAFDG